MGSDYIRPMRHSWLLLLAGTLLAMACKEEEKPLLSATLHARCSGCVVRYAPGALQSKTDTLMGTVDPGTGDTLPGEGQWTLHLKDGDNLFFRACRLERDSGPPVQGTLTLWVDGGVKPMQAATDTAACTAINGPAFAP